MIFKKFIFQNVTKSQKYQFTSRFLNQAKKQCLTAILYNSKVVSNFNFSLVFENKIKFNFHYEKMTKTINEHLQEKYKNSIFQILEICKIKTLERLGILILIRQLGKNTLGCTNV